MAFRPADVRSKSLGFPRAVSWKQKPSRQFPACRDSESMQTTEAKKVFKHQDSQHGSKCRQSFTQCL